MKNILAALLVSCLLASAAKSTFIDLASFGSDSFEVSVFSTANFTQTSSGVTFNTIGFGDVLGGGFTSGAQDWGSYNTDDFAVKMSLLSGTAPNINFGFLLFDSEFNQAQFEGFTTGIATDTYVPLIFLGFVGSSPLSTIVGAQFSWNDSASGATVALQEVAAVPEPSTYALLALGALALGGYAARRRVRK